MLLPSALSCDGGRAIPATSSMLLSPAPRHGTRIPQVNIFSPSPIISTEESSSSLRIAAVEGIFTTCKKLHQILSLEPPRTASTRLQQVSATTQTHNALHLAISTSESTRNAPSSPRATQTISTSSCVSNETAGPAVTGIPRTPVPREANVVRVPKTPMRRNKRRRAIDGSDDDGGFYHIRLQSPKRQRCSLVGSTRKQSSQAESSTMIQHSRFNRRYRQFNNPCAAVASLPHLPNTFSFASSEQPTLPQSLEIEASPTEQRADSYTRDWSNAEDRLLVELVLQKMRLSQRDWAECAKSLGRDPRTVGNRWEMIMGNLVGEAGQQQSSAQQAPI